MTHRVRAHRRTAILVNRPARITRLAAIVSSLVGALLLSACGAVSTAISSTTSLGSRDSTLALAGKVVGIDPGHNGRNYLHTGFINHQVFNGRTNENCDTTGTSTNGGYSESLFNFNVARYLRADLLATGAHVVMTRSTNQGVGPCIDRRAQILNHAHVNVAIDIHADGAPSWGRGFAILEPVTDEINKHIVASSLLFGADVRSSMLAQTPMPVSNYDGVNGFKFRSDLAGLNLATEPKVLIECGNMRNARDGALLTSPAFQKRIALALSIAITNFLTNK